MQASSLACRAVAPAQQSSVGTAAPKSTRLPPGSRLAIHHRHAALPRPGHKARPVSLSPPAAAGSEAAAPIAAVACGSAAGVQWLKAAGVPLVEALRQMTLQQAALHSLSLVLGTVLMLWVHRRLWNFVDSKMTDVLEGTKHSSGVQLLMLTALAAGHRPVNLLLPFYGLIYCTVVAGAFTDVLMSRLGSSAPHALQMVGGQLLDGLRQLIQLLQHTNEGVVVIFLAWFVIGWKNRLIAALVNQLQGARSEERAGLARLLVPLNNLFTYGIGVVAALVVLSAYGLDTKPMLTFGGITTVAAGLAVQRAAQNLVAAVGFYTGRPFIVGDHVQLLGITGATVLEGTVARITPLHTVILTAADSNPVYVTNTQVTNYMLKNLTKGRLMQEASAGSGGGSFSDGEFEGSILLSL